MVEHACADDPERALHWREDLAARAARVYCAVYLISVPLFVLMLENAVTKATMVIWCLLSAAFAGVPQWAGRPKGALRAWLIVGPALTGALLGFAYVGFLAGPAVLLTLTLMTGGLMLGKKGLAVLCAIAFSGLAVVAYAVLHGSLPSPGPVDVAMTNPRAWIRTITLACFASFVFGALIIDVVTRLDDAVRLARAEMLRREHAEREKAEAEIAALEAKQLETLGRLAAGVAHDFNNNLTAIIGCAELLAEALPRDAHGREMVDVILTSSERAAALTRQLLAYSRKAQMVLKPVDLHSLVEGACALLRASLPGNIDVRIDLTAQEHIVLADAALLQNAIVNLMVNARDAMSADGGSIAVSTANRVVTQEDGLGPLVAPGPYVVLDVRDTGTGIDATTLSKIFEPFFTTKPVGHGTGLGLAAVAGTVRAHGGAIDVESEVGRGSLFRILLRRHEGSADEREAEAQILRGSGHILLVDDDMVVRNTAEGAMRSFGYDVTSASDGPRAIELVKADPSKFGLVVLYLRMPKMSGRATFEHLHQIAPTLPVLLWSGYGAEHDVQQLLLDGAAGFIQKPYATSELSRTLARLMAKGGSQNRT